jgi:hypothetical protein
MTTSWSFDFLRSNGVLKVSCKQYPFDFVHEDHPVVRVLKKDGVCLGFDINKQAKFDTHYKVPNDVMDYCCSKISTLIEDAIMTGYPSKKPRLNPPTPVQQEVCPSALPSSG